MDIGPCWSSGRTAVGIGTVDWIVSLAGSVGPIGVMVLYAADALALELVVGI